MVKVKIYTKGYCPYCDRAKRLLHEQGYDYEETDVTEDTEAFEKLKQRTGHMTVPQIFFDDKFIGGFDDLQKYLKEKEEASMGEE